MEFPAYMKKLVDLLNKQKGFLRQFAQDTESIQMIKVRSQDNVSSFYSLGRKGNSKLAYRYLVNFYFPQEIFLTGMDPINRTPFVEALTEVGGEEFVR